LPSLSSFLPLLQVFSFPCISPLEPIANPTTQALGFSCSTSLVMWMQLFCRGSIAHYPGIVSRCCFNPLVTIPMAPVTSVW
jgi:hypothetical protein